MRSLCSLRLRYLHFGKFFSFSTFLLAFTIIFFEPTIIAFRSFIHIVFGLGRKCNMGVLQSLYNFACNSTHVFLDLWKLTKMRVHLWCPKYWFLFGYKHLLNLKNLHNIDFLFYWGKWVWVLQPKIQLSNNYNVFWISGCWVYWLERGL